MAKLSLRVFKKGKPIYWIIGGLVLFVIFYLLFNRGGAASGGGGVNVISTGPSEAMQNASLQASTAIATAQIGAGIEAARIQVSRDTANLQAQIALAQLGSGERVALETLNAERSLAQLDAQTNLLVNEQNINYALETARVASETTLSLRKFETDMFSEQLAANRDMFRIQSENLITQSMIAQVSSLKAKDRDTALAAILATRSGQGFSGGKGDDYIYIAPAPTTRYLPGPNPTM